MWNAGFWKLLRRIPIPERALYNPPRGGAVDTDLEGKDSG